VTSLLRSFTLLCLAAAPRAQDNVLVVVADDMGVDRVGAYAEHPDPGHTPRIDQLAAQGVLFRNAWSSPYCSPTRAGVLTGRHAFRTGIGQPVGYSLAGGQALSPRETLLPEVLAHAAVPWRSVALGKWHLATIDQGGLLHPLLSGFDAHVGTMTSVGASPSNGTYYSFEKNVNGQLVHVDGYATTDTTDDALRLLRSTPEPWFAWLAYNAPHVPLHKPPEELHSYDLQGSPKDTPGAHQRAAIEALDSELGRLLDMLDPDVLARTTVVVLGDNGTDDVATDAPFLPEHAKGTPYEGGVNVPLIVAGPRVGRPGGECDALVQTLDLFATIAEIAGVDPRTVVPPGTALDSVSLLPYLQDPHHSPLRRWAYTESFSPNGPGPWGQHERATRDARHKLIRRLDAPDELYDLQADPFEQSNLLAGPLTRRQAAAYAALSQLLDSLR